MAFSCDYFKKLTVTLLLIHQEQRDPCGHERRNDNNRRN